MTERPSGRQRRPQRRTPEATFVRVQRRSREPGATPVPAQRSELRTAAPDEPEGREQAMNHALLVAWVAAIAFVSLIAAYNAIDALP